MMQVNKVTSRRYRFIFRLFQLVGTVCRCFARNFNTIPLLLASPSTKRATLAHKKTPANAARKFSKHSTTSKIGTRRRTTSRTKQKRHQPGTRNDHSSLVRELQVCLTPEQVLSNVGKHINTKIDPCGTLASLILVRLSKQLISQSNCYQQSDVADHHKNEASNVISSHTHNFQPSSIDSPVKSATSDLWNIVLKHVVDTLSKVDWTSSATAMDAAVEGTKAAAVLSRLHPTLSDDVWKSLQFAWNQRSNVDTTNNTTTSDLVQQLEQHHLSGLQWSWDCFRLQQRHVVEKPSKNATVASSFIFSASDWTLPPRIQQAYDALNLPFYVRPGYFSSFSVEEYAAEQFHVPEIVRQVDFQVDEIRTSSNRIVPERRQTAWQGDDHVSAFTYSGKSMKRLPWSPIVRKIRDGLQRQEHHVERTRSRTTPANPCYYAGCLLNLYPDGGSGMRYHIDPDQGTLWDYPTAVVSIGASRRIAFRQVAPLPTLSPQKQNMIRVMTTTNKKRQKAKRRPNDLGSSSSSRDVDDLAAKNLDTTIKPSCSFGTSTRKQPHTFVVMHGDVTEMFDDCQSNYQHAVKTAEDKNETTPRVSLVFKKTLSSTSKINI